MKDEAFGQRVFNYLSENLRLEVNGPHNEYGSNSKVVTIKLTLKDPDGNEQVLSEQSFPVADIPSNYL